MKARWAVYPCDAYLRTIGPPVYLVASTRIGAELAGRALLRMLGRRARRVMAVPYDPARDPAMRGYVREVEEG